MKLHAGLFLVFLISLAISAIGAPERAVEKRADTLTTIAGSLRTAAGIAGNVGTLLSLTTSAIPLAGVFTGLFSFIIGLIPNKNAERAYWEKIQKKMTEIAQKEVANYHELLAQGFIEGIRKSLQLYNRFGTTHNGKPNEQKIQEGVVLSGIINNSKMWVNTELGRNPQRMILYYMEVAAVDVAVLYSLAALYGNNKNHWIRLESRVNHHINDVKEAARQVVAWRSGDKIVQCQSTECKVGTKRCGPKGASTCDVKQPCKKGIDTLREVCRRYSRKVRCGSKTCTRYYQECSKYNKTKVGASNCEFFKSELRSLANRWLETNVYKYVRGWEQLVKRARRYTGK